MTIRLHPAELGMVQVRIDRPSGGASHVAITTEKAETLQLLQRDAADLHRALDLAGVPAEGRVVSFHAASTSLTADGHDGAAGWSADGNGGQSRRDPPEHGEAPRAQVLAPEVSDDSPAGGWRHVGLDITA
ncbi:MAG: flagellar hook-length control protein FliK [Proteobacteria bacterium]|nr:flagellar hook-length control protein FliK [Pseudomonadota bacterium]